MDKCREAFEELSNIQTFLPSFKFDEEANEYMRSERFTQPEYMLGFFNGAWYAWQSRQAEVDELRANLERADEIATRENNRANKLQEDNTSTTILLGKTIVKKEALEASIAKALVKWNSIVSILTTMDLVIVPDDVFKKLDELEEALRGNSDINLNR